MQDQELMQDYRTPGRISGIMSKWVIRDKRATMEESRNSHSVGKQSAPLETTKR